MPTLRDEALNVLSPSLSRTLNMSGVSLSPLHDILCTATLSNPPDMICEMGYRLDLEGAEASAIMQLTQAGAARAAQAQQGDALKRLQTSEGGAQGAAVGVARSGVAHAQNGSEGASWWRAFD